MDSLNLDHSSIHLGCRRLSFQHFDWYLLARCHSLDIAPPQLYLRALAALDGCDPEKISDAESSGLSGSKPAPAGSALLAVNILAVHHEEVVQAGPVHPTAIVGNRDALALAIKRHSNVRVRSLIDILKAIHDVLPDNQVVALEEARCLEKVSGNMTTNNELFPIITHDVHSP
jgi:hypothetical protein